MSMVVLGMEEAGDGLAFHTQPTKAEHAAEEERQQTMPKKLR